jgi:hypothetical protein
MDAPAAPLAQYRRRHAEPEATAVPPPRAYRQVAVVPAMGEFELLVPAVASILAADGAGEIGLIVVLNARESSPPDVHEANDRARAWLTGLNPEQVTVIDRAAPGRRLPDREGVGLARKVGNDVALAWRMAGRVARRFVLQTDADAIVPADWFARAEAAEGSTPAERAAVALTFPYRHEAVAPVTAGAIARYEAWLRLHRIALADNGSPYAFQAIGSTLAIDAEALAHVRGFPRSMAGEDFYVLDKLAKLGRIRPLGGHPIVLAARESDRVPFGTGRTMLGMVRGEADAEPRLPDPRSFAALGRWLRILELAAGPPQRADALPLTGDRADLVDRLGRELAAHDLPPEPIIDILERMGALRFTVEAMAMNLARSVRRRRLHTWFDAFRTLRFRHTMRDELWPDRTWEEREAAASPRSTPTDPLARLESLREVDERGQASDPWPGLG